MPDTASVGSHIASNPLHACTVVKPASVTYITTQDPVACLAASVIGKAALQEQMYRIDNCEIAGSTHRPCQTRERQATATHFECLPAAFTTQVPTRQLSSSPPMLASLVSSMLKSRSCTLPCSPCRHTSSACIGDPGEKSVYTSIALRFQLHEFGLLVCSGTWSSNSCSATLASPEHVTATNALLKLRQI